MLDFKIYRASSEELFPNGSLNARLIIEEGCWYLCTDTAELFIGTSTDDGLTLIRVNDAESHPVIEEVKTKVETVIPTVEKIESEIVPTISEVKSTTDEIKAWVDNKEFLQHIDLEGLATEDFVHEMIAKAELDDKDVDLDAYYTKTEVEALIPEVPAKVSELENDTGYITAEEIPETDLSNYYNKSETETLVNEAVTRIEIPEEYITVEELAAEGFIKEHQSLAEYAKTKTVVTQKYEVLPIEGMLISYRDQEVRINTQYVDIDSLPKQNAGDGSSDRYYYATFRAYAPENATSVIEGSSDKMDTEHSELAVDTYGRKYTTIWAAIASKNDNTWTKFGDTSTVDKYLGFYYNFHWYNGETLLCTDKVRVILTNNVCHDDLVPDAVARRIDEKTSSIANTVTNITNQIQNIENNYVTKDTVTEVVTSEVTSRVEEQVETKVIEVIQDKVNTGEIPVSTSSITYGDF